MCNVQYFAARGAAMIRFSRCCLCVITLTVTSLRPFEPASRQTRLDARDVETLASVSTGSVDVGLAHEVGASVSRLFPVQAGEVLAGEGFSRITLQELRVECFFPLDDATTAAARSLLTRTERST